MSEPIFTKIPTVGRVRYFLMRLMWWRYKKLATGVLYDIHVGGPRPRRASEMSDLYNCPVCHSSGPCQHSHPAVPAREPEATPQPGPTVEDKAFTLKCSCGSEFKPECPDCGELWSETKPVREETTVAKKIVSVEGVQELVAEIKRLVARVSQLEQELRDAGLVEAYFEKDKPARWVNVRAEDYKRERDTLREALERAELLMSSVYMAAAEDFPSRGDELPGARGKTFYENLTVIRGALAQGKEK